MIEKVRALNVSVTPDAAVAEKGRNNGRTSLGLLGAVGGAYGGGERDRRSGYRVTVRMADGSARTVYMPTAPAFAIGDRVQVVNGTLAAQG